MGGGGRRSSNSYDTPRPRCRLLSSNFNNGSQQTAAASSSSSSVVRDRQTIIEMDLMNPRRKFPCVTRESPSRHETWFLVLRYLKIERHYCWYRYGSIRQMYVRKIATFQHTSSSSYCAAAMMTTMPYAYVRTSWGLVVNDASSPRPLATA